MQSNFSKRMITVLECVKQESLRLGDDTIGVEHLILGIIKEGKGSAVHVLSTLGLEMEDLRKIIEEVIAINENKTLPYQSQERSISKQAKNILDKSFLELKNLKDRKIKTIHVLLSGVFSKLSFL